MNKGMDIALSPLELTTLNVQDSIACKFSEVSFEDISDVEEEEDTRPRYCQYCRRSKTCCMMVYLCIALLCASSLASLFVVGMVIVMPYSNAYHFMETSCRVVELSYITSDLKCSCGKRCNSSYPCIVLNVEYQTGNAASLELRTAIHEDETNLQRQVG